MKSLLRVIRLNLTKTKSQKLHQMKYNYRPIYMLLDTREWNNVKIVD